MEFALNRRSSFLRPDAGNRADNSYQVGGSLRGLELFLGAGFRRTCPNSDLKGS